MHPTLQDMPSMFYMIQVSRSSDSFFWKLQTKFDSNCLNSLILDERPMFRDFSDGQGHETSSALVHNVEFELEGRSINVYI